MDLRQTNKLLRRQRILDAARDVVLTRGVDGLTTRGLAAASGVTVPTIYNLIGGRDEVLHRLVRDGAERMGGEALPEEERVTLGLVERWLDACCEAIARDEGVHRAAMLAADHFLGSAQAGAPRTPSSDGEIALASRLCQSLQEAGLLRGAINAHTLGQQAFICFRDPLRDWCYGQIGLDELRRRFARGLYMLLCADATEGTQKKLVSRIRRLEFADVQPDLWSLDSAS